MKTQISIVDALDQAIDQAGSQRKLAQSLGVSQQAIWEARKRGRVSAALAYRIQQVWGVPAALLCPHVFAADVSRQPFRPPLEEETAS